MYTVEGEEESLDLQHDLHKLFTWESDWAVSGGADDRFQEIYKNLTDQGFSPDSHFGSFTRKTLFQTLKV